MGVTDVTDAVWATTCSREHLQFESECTFVLVKADTEDGNHGNLLEVKSKSYTLLIPSGKLFLCI